MGALPSIPPSCDIEGRAILKQLAASHRYLAELKGVAKTIPNEDILINTLLLQEAKDSSAVENIITTQDELFKEELEFIAGPTAKEVRDYAAALRRGFSLVREHGLITVNYLIDIYRAVKKTDAGIRRTPGTALVNERTGEIIYTPPQAYETLLALLANLERYINDDGLSNADPLVKMAVIHYQFESIHPFTDGNGRTGRILNIVYLVLKGLLDTPILYLSRYIIQRKTEYYRLLQAVREHNAWEEWVVFMLVGIEQTSRQSILIVEGIGRIMQDYKHRIRQTFPGFYSQELLNNLFFHPYTKIDLLMQDLHVSRQTAAKYLDALSVAGFLRKEHMGKANYYINVALLDLLANIPPLGE